MQEPARFNQWLGTKMHICYTVWPEIEKIKNLKKIFEICIWSQNVKKGIMEVFHLYVTIVWLILVK